MDDKSQWEFIHHLQTQTYEYYVVFEEKHKKNGKTLIFAQRISAEKLNMHNNACYKKSKHLLTAGQYFKLQTLGT